MCVYVCVRVRVRVCVCVCVGSLSSHRHTEAGVKVWITCSLVTLVALEAQNIQREAERSRESVRD